LGFIDFADPVSSHRYEVSAYSMSIKEEHWAECPDGKRTKESVGFKVTLNEIVEVSSKG
jgi:hypothetical protein